jgi:hypothetical protein
MMRGPALREQLVPLIYANRDLLDEHTEVRFAAMCERYGIALPAL